MSDMLLKYFTDTDIGQDIIEHIIPLVDHLRRRIPLRFSTMFSKSLLSELNLTGDIDCHDLDASDMFFDNIKTK
jgi:hypothetical protein